MSHISDLRRRLDQKIGQQKHVVAELAKAEESVRALVLAARYAEEAQLIIQNVAQLTQQELEYHVGELVTLALASVFDDPYEFSVEFVQRRGRTECDLWFVRNGQKVDPMSASGGGAVDVASFALRVALWSLAQPKTRPVLLLDEPLRFLKGDILPERGARMMKEISDKLGIQIIMVSHIPDQIEGADCRIEVKLRDSVSHVRTN